MVGLRFVEYQPFSFHVKDPEEVIYNDDDDDGVEYDDDDLMTPTAGKRGWSTSSSLVGNNNGGCFDSMVHSALMMIMVHDNPRSSIYQKLLARLENHQTVTGPSMTF